MTESDKILMIEKADERKLDDLDVSSLFYKRGITNQNEAVKALDKVSSIHSRLTPTPTKQIILTSVRRKDCDEESLNLGEKSESNETRPTSASCTTTLHTPGMSNFKVSTDEGYRLDTVTEPDESNPHTVNTTKVAEAPTFPKDALLSKKTDEQEDTDDSNNETTDDNSMKTAPTNLLMEFLGCVMAKDYEAAERLCQMILMFEPKNPEALKFQPLIKEKLQLLKEEAENGDKTEDESDSSDEDDDDDDDSNNSSVDSSAEESETEETTKTSQAASSKS